MEGEGGKNLLKPFLLGHVLEYQTLLGHLSLLPRHRGTHTHVHTGMITQHKQIWRSLLVMKNAEHWLRTNSNANLVMLQPSPKQPQRCWVDWRRTSAWSRQRETLGFLEIKRTTGVHEIIKVIFVCVCVCVRQGRREGIGEDGRFLFDHRRLRNASILTREQQPWWEGSAIEH